MSFERLFTAEEQMLISQWNRILEISVVFLYALRGNLALEERMRYPKGVANKIMMAFHGEKWEIAWRKYEKRLNDEEHRGSDYGVFVPSDIVKEIMQHPDMAKELMEKIIREGMEFQAQRYNELLDQIGKPCGDGFFNLIKEGGEE